MHAPPGALRALLTSLAFSMALLGANSSCGGAAPQYSRSSGHAYKDQGSAGGYATTSAAPAEDRVYADADSSGDYDDDGDYGGGDEYDDYEAEEMRVEDEGAFRIAQAAPGPNKPSPAPPPGGGDKKEPADPTPTPDPTGNTGGGGGSAGAVATSAEEQEKRPKPLLIYNATLHLAVFEAAKAIDAIEKLAIERGGYLVRRTDTTITIRIPAEGFHESLELVADVGDELHRDVSVSDVTAEFRDLHTQLANLEAVRKRLEILLDKAKTVQEALQVERELTRVTGEIERIKGRLKLLGELIAYSTITVSFQASPVENISSTVELPFNWLGRLGLPNLLDL